VLLFGNTVAERVSTNRFVAAAVIFRATNGCPWPDKHLRLAGAMGGGTSPTLAFSLP
jgi:hypothetical protein